MLREALISYEIKKHMRTISNIRFWHSSLSPVNSTPANTPQHTWAVTGDRSIIQREWGVTVKEVGPLGLGSGLIKNI